MGGRLHSTDSRLLSKKPLLLLFSWYFFSGLTLFLNKHIVGALGGSGTVLGCTQMACTMLGGFVQLRYPLGMFTKVAEEKRARSKDFRRNMMVLGGLRFVTVLLGLVALEYLEVSFTETVKSTAPAFTAVISLVLLGERTGIYANLSLIPVMGGLALCSASEVHFDFVGFLAALATNVAECAQNVVAKMFISGPAHQYTPAEIQYYTSLYSLVVQFPCMAFLVDWGVFLASLKEPESFLHFSVMYVANGICYHFQTISAFGLMDFISPVTHSVANTGKRALLIWLSVIVFGNPVTLMSAFGTVIVIVGVLLYSKAKEIDGIGKMPAGEKTLRRAEEEEEENII